MKLEERGTQSCSPCGIRGEGKVVILTPFCWKRGAHRISHPTVLEKRGNMHSHPTVLEERGRKGVSNPHPKVLEEEGNQAYSPHDIHPTTYQQISS